jgi:hypothetical protein
MVPAMLKVNHGVSNGLQLTCLPNSFLFWDYIGAFPTPGIPLSSMSSISLGHIWADAVLYYKAM